MPVPTLIRFLVIIAILGGLGYAAMFALATLVTPEPRDMSVTLPNSRVPPR
jgi:phage shock protein PspC (stress-responsive transcriptional regulator)